MDVVEIVVVIIVAAAIHVVAHAICFSAVQGIAVVINVVGNIAVQGVVVDGTIHGEHSF